MNYFQYVYFALLYITLAHSLVGYRSFAKNLRFVTLYLTLHTIVDSFAIYLHLFRHVNNNLFLYHLFTPIEYLVLAGMFATSIHHSRIVKFIVGSTLLVLFVAIATAYWLIGLRQNNSYAVGLESLLIITWSLLLLKELLMNQNEIYPFRLPMFWISLGLLAYFVGTMLVETSINYFLTNSPSLAKAIYKTEYFFEYLLLITINVGVYQAQSMKDLRMDP